jgi:hypothetical protein
MVTHEGIFGFFSLHSKFVSSVADPRCLSRIRIPDPNPDPGSGSDFFHPGSELFPSWIPDPHQRI